MAPTSTQSFTPKQNPLPVFLLTRTPVGSLLHLATIWTASPIWLLPLSTSSRHGMHTLSYTFAAIPLMVIACAGCSGLVYVILHPKLLDSPNVYKYNPLPLDYSRLIFFAFITPLLLKLILLMRDIFTLPGPSLTSSSHHKHRIHHHNHQTTPQASNFDRFYFPIVEELLNFGLIYYLAHHNSLEVELPDKPNNILYRWSLDQLAVLICAYNVDKIVFTLIEYCPYNYSKKYEKFIELFTMWQDHEQHINSDKTDAAFVFADNFIKNHHDSTPVKSPPENRDSVDTAKTLVSDKYSPSKASKIKFPSTLNIADDSNALSSLYKLKTINRFQSVPILATTPDDLSTSSSDISIVGAPPRIKKAAFKSCCELVDKLYSVSPKNTYHLNQASAYALTADQYQPLASQLVNEIDGESDDDLDNHDSTIISEHDVVPYDPSTPDQLSPTKTQSHHTHWGYGGGGGFGFEMPNGGSIHFGGGGGMDYSDDDGTDGPNEDLNIFNTSYGSCEPTEPNQQTPLSSSVSSPFLNSKSLKFSNHLLVSFINWFRWLCPFLPITLPDSAPLQVSSPYQSPKKKSTKIDPLVKQKLSCYTLNKQQNSESVSLKSSFSARNIDLESQSNLSFSSNAPASSSFSPNHDFNSFEAFVFTYFDYDLHTLYKPFEVDPIFKKFDVLSKDFPFIYLIILNLNHFLWVAATFLTFSLGFIFISIECKQIIKILLGLIVVKFFNLNYLNGQFNYSFQVRLCCETVINTCLLSLVVYYYCIVT